MRQSLLALLSAAATDPEYPGELVFGDLAEAVVGLAVTEAERAQARQALLAVLPAATGPWMAGELAKTIAGLSPTVDDLSGSDRWPPPSTAVLLAPPCARTPNFPPGSLRCQSSRNTRAGAKIDAVPTMPR